MGYLNKTMRHDYKSFIEAVCKKFQCPEAIPFIKQGFNHLCEAMIDGRYINEPSSGQIPGKFTCPDSSADSIPLVYPMLQSEIKDSYIAINLNRWVEISQLPIEIAHSLLNNLFNLDALCTLTVESWTSPSRYFEDPGDGGYKVSLSDTIGSPELSEALLTQLNELSGSEFDPETIQKLKATVPQICTEFEKLEGYEDSEQW